MTKNIYTQLNLNTNRVLNIGTPLLNSDATTKAYVDAINTNLVTSIQALTTNLTALDNRFNSLVSTLGPNPILGSLALKNSVTNTDVATGAAIAWSKISKSGAQASDVGAISTVPWSTPGEIGNTTPNSAWFSILRIWNEALTFTSRLIAYVTTNRNHYLPDATGTILLHPFNNPSPFIFNHFMGGLGEFVSSVASGGTVTFTTNTRTGDARVASTSATNSRAAIRTNLSGVRLGQSTGLQVDVFVARLYISAVQTSTQRALIRWGFFNSDSAIATNGVYFAYDVLISNQIICVCMSNSATTLANTTITVDSSWINTNHDYKIIITTGGLEARFYIDNNLVATTNTNIPTAATQEVALGISINYVFGSTAYNATVDYMGGGVLQNIFI